MDLAGLLDGPTLEGPDGLLAEQHSPHRLGAVRVRTRAAAGPTALAPVTHRPSPVITAGTPPPGERADRPTCVPRRTRSQVRVRLRFHGPAPAEVLEACHLYSYAEIGRHDIEGGLLLRRDLHRLFDQGLLAVTPDGTIDVGESLKPYDLYSTCMANSSR